VTDSHAVCVLLDALAGHTLQHLYGRIESAHPREETLIAEVDAL
jgi:hypothetical protein